MAVVVGSSRCVGAATLAAAGREAEAATPVDRRMMMCAHSAFRPVAPVSHGPRRRGSSPASLQLRRHRGLLRVSRHISTRGGVLLEKVEGRRERGTRKQVGRDTMLAGRPGYLLGWDHLLTDTWAGLGWAGLGWARLGWDPV